MNEITSLRAAVSALIALSISAEESYCGSGPDDEPAWHVLAYSDAVDALRDEAKAELASFLTDADVPRAWRVTDESGYVTEDLGFFTVVQARRAVRSWIERGDYEASESTTWIDACLSCEETGEEETVTVQVDPDEPPCPEESAHDWQSPHALVGGLKENPGVWGKGGGTISEEVCMHCGCSRKTDTWAQRPDTGEQGLTSVSYEIGKYSEEVAELEDA